MIYLIRIEGMEFVKIGYTKDDETLKWRVADLQIGNPMPLIVAHVEKGTYAHESRYHEMLSDVRKSGEWFFLGKHLGKFLRNAEKHGISKAIKMLTGKRSTLSEVREEDRIRQINLRYEQLLQGIRIEDDI